jgi:hypothetical protein
LIGSRVPGVAQEASARREEHDVKASSVDPCGERRVRTRHEQLERCAIPRMAQQLPGLSQLVVGGLAHRCVVVDRRSGAAANPRVLRREGQDRQHRAVIPDQPASQIECR